MKKLIFGTVVFGLLSSQLFAQKLWENLNIELSGGKYIWARLDRDSSCYNILVGSPAGSNTGIYGNASNCSKNIDGYWSVNGCGHGSDTVHGGLSDVVKHIVNDMCQ